jgi:metacaspase-1
MAEGITINIGLNQVDADHYGGWSGDLVACEFDAKDMNGIAKANGFHGKTILTREATSKAVSRSVKEAASKLETGDILFLTYSGHGGQVPDRHSDEEPDARDETWVLYDRQLVDDELFSLWGEFQPGVRIFVLSDSCHSGSVVRAMYGALNRETFERGFIQHQNPRLKSLPPAVQSKTYEQNKEVYEEIQRTFPRGDDIDVRAHVILISGCQDNQESLDGDRNGLFTETLLEVWDGGKFRGGHRALRRRILNKMPPTQSPNYFLAGARNAVFERQKPLTI